MLLSFYSSIIYTGSVSCLLWVYSGKYYFLYFSDTKFLELQGNNSENISFLWKIDLVWVLQLLWVALKHFSINATVLTSRIVWDPVVDG